MPSHLRADQKLTPAVKGIFQMISNTNTYLEHQPPFQGACSSVWTPSHKEMLPHVKSKSPLITESLEETLKIIESNPCNTSTKPQHTTAAYWTIISHSQSRAGSSSMYVFQMITLTLSEFLLPAGFPSPWFQLFVSCSWDLPLADCGAFSIHVSWRDKKKGFFDRNIIWKQINQRQRPRRYHL